MVDRPKRRKSKDNPYILGFNKQKNIYFIIFRNTKNIYDEIEISEKIYKELNNFELSDLSILNEYDNHIEHSELYDETLYKRAINKPIAVEKIVENKIEMELILNIINQLPEIQKRRLKKYYFDEKTFEVIAKEEGCTKRAVKFSVDIAVKKITKKIKK